MAARGETRNGRGISAGAVVALLGLAALIIFIVQNRESVEFRFLVLDFSWPLWLYTIVTAVLGALVWTGIGMVRRYQRRTGRR
jgi:uncharacterized integral membrane protein